MLQRLVAAAPATWTAEVPAVLAALALPELGAFYLAAAASAARHPDAFPAGPAEAVLAALTLSRALPAPAPHVPDAAEFAGRAWSGLLRFVWRTGTGLSGDLPAVLDHLHALAEPLTRPAPSPAAPATPAPRAAGSVGAHPNWRRQGPLVAIGACTVVGILALALWPSNDRSDGDAGGAPTSTPHGNASPSKRSKQPTSSPTKSRTADAGPATSPPASPVKHDKTATPRPSHSPTRVPSRMPTGGWTHMHPAVSPSLCLTEGRERNGRTDREIAVQHSCADAPLPRVYMEKLSRSTYRIQWHNPDPGKGIGCLAVDGASTSPGALLAPRGCADSND